jgi:hypothetical protein
MDARKIEEPEKLEKKLASVPPGAIAVDALVGAAAGAALGVLAGPPGIVAGAVLGGAVGGAAAAALHAGHVRERRKDAQLDEDIGVIGGNLGEAPPHAPKSERGVFHAASLGLGGGGGGTPSEGPMQNPEGD